MTQNFGYYVDPITNKWVKIELTDIEINITKPFITKYGKKLIALEDAMAILELRANPITEAELRSMVGDFESKLVQEEKPW